MAGLDWLTARPIAHRGLHDDARGIIENTPSAISAAVEANYAIEVDLHISADGEAMVYHDAALGRITDGEGRVDAMTAADLKRVAFKKTADRMMTLGDLLDLVGGRVALFIELKSHFDRDERLPRRVAQGLQSYAGPVAVMSFDPYQMEAMQDLAPGLPRGIDAERGGAGDGAVPGSVEYLVHSVRSRPHFISYRVTDLPAPLPLLARYLLGMPLLAWTVRSEDDRRRAARFADQIFFEGFRP
jgi:glycerophosphoryl diester phosphodiesterase